MMRSRKGVVETKGQRSLLSMRCEEPCREVKEESERKDVHVVRWCEIKEKKKKRKGKKERKEGWQS